MMTLTPRLLWLSLGALALASMASAEICRSVSGSWTDNGTDYHTQIWTSGKDGCKKIRHTVGAGDAARQIDGYDCDCDLRADGQEVEVAGAPHPYNAEKMSAVCNGPMADPKTDLTS